MKTNVKIGILMLRIDFLNECIDNIEKILYSDMSKERSLKTINRYFKSINRASNLTTLQLN